MKEMVNVQLTACADVAYGEDLLICGSAQPLGCWSPSEAAPMTWQEDGRWVVQVPLPCGVLVELKVVVKRPCGSLRWLGAGPEQKSNIVLETKLGRGGARSTRFVGETPLPFNLEVADLQDDVVLGASCRTPTAQEVAASRTPALAYDGGQPAAPAAMLPYSGTPSVYMPPQQQQEVASAALLAGAAAGAGRNVTYTTTSTTTVTINGAGDGISGAQVPCGAPQLSPPHGGHSGELADGSTACGQREGCGGGVCGGGADVGTEATPEQREAFLAARRKNTGLSRLGPVALCWPAAEGCKEPSSVNVRGSWDGWARDLAMEPAPGGGWRLLLVLPPGNYQFKFIVDGTWTTSDDFDRTQCENKNNIVYASDMALAPTVSPLALTGPEKPSMPTSPSVALVAVGGC
mmetsp:Transcript_46847/g.123755  ORF Transcript_46847/g.123755 Transcript_46847/m.123755 type:complete len:404 (-) Transcript_46847:395-1606(-)